ncbi:unnamed protein product, partial [Mesorhabditis belari]|uniref:Uncharacterized protein n=1 Tax=Mesorhabditis belari TaxID=2138241 RepID=A0AAF3FMR8_9BILA
MDAAHSSQDSSNKNETPKKTGFDSIVRRYERSTERNRDNTDFELSAWLVAHPEVASPIGPLLKHSFWRSAFVIAQRSNSNQLEFVTFLLNNESQLREGGTDDDAGRIISMLLALKWEHLDSKIVDKLFYLLAGWPKTSSKHWACLQLAQTFGQNYPSASTVLFLVSSTYLLSPHGLGLGLPLLKGCSCAGSANWSIFMDETGKLTIFGFFGSQQKPRVLDAGELSLKRSSDDSKRDNEAKKSPPPPPPVKTFRLPKGKPFAVSCGAVHCLIVSTDRLLYSFGQNTYGQCGVGDDQKHETPTVISGDWGSIISLSAGQYHSGIVLNDGSVYTWGWGMYGQLGLGERRGGTDAWTPTFVPDLPEKMKAISCGRAHSVLLGESGSIYTTGCGLFGQLGTLVDIRKRFTFTKLSLSPPGIEREIRVRTMATKYYHTVAITEDNQVFEWGKNPHDLKMKMFVMKRLRNAQAAKGENGAKIPPHNPDIPKDFLGVFKVKHEIDADIVDVSTGLSHSALLTNKQHIYTWGKSLDHQLGHGNKLERNEPQKVVDENAWIDVQCGGHFTLGVSESGHAHSWGRNDFSQCGVISEKIPQSPRKFIFKAKGDVKKCVHLPDESSYVSKPQVISSILLEIPAKKENVEEKLTPSEVVERIRTADTRCLRVASSILDKYYQDLPSLAAAFVHMLGGNLWSAVNTVKRVIDNRNGVMTDQDIGYMSGVLWEGILGGDGPSTTLLQHALLHLPKPTDEEIQEKLRQIWPSAWSNTETQNGLTGMEKAKMLSKWTPSSSQLTTNVHISGSSISPKTAKVRVWAACGHTEAPSESTHCGECIREWLEIVKGNQGETINNHCTA